ncbi:DUF1054 domain-containing protein [Aneurinibacillus tyrosinisolvens]|uniref:DUF1054 domain-containing protein n=1 Tax=Aneurinibacillus tyrosinisolvens TaxID=1443435 RepID=UPI00063F9C45|nr:DUF1054 domain-containing protein [Aneurinibacillus tyrosinisolvens]
MSFKGFSQEDFAVFTIPGLEARMEALKASVRPKLEELGAYFAPLLSSEMGDEMFYHTAKHARRTVHPPVDTWVAWAANKRGYKMLPHFQVGLWETHLFVWFAIIYESPLKPDFARQLEQHRTSILPHLPEEFVWSLDHTKPQVFSSSEMDEAKITDAIHKLKHVKKSEILCGITIDRHDPIVSDGQALLEKIEHTFLTLKPLYELCRVSV